MGSRNTTVGHLAAAALLVGAAAAQDAPQHAPTDAPQHAPTDAPSPAPPPPDGPAVEAPPAPGALRLADAPKAERQTLERLLAGESWPRRALAAMRLERYGCDESRRILEGLLADESWQVRAFAIRTLGRRRDRAAAGAFDREDVPLVLRAALRYRNTVDPERVARGVRYLARREDLRAKLLAAELGAASGDPELSELAEDAARKVILRMDRIEAGALSPRLAALTGQPDLRRPHRWQRWLQSAGRRFELRPVYGLPGSTQERVEPGPLARVDAQQFAALESYIEVLSARTIDLAICMDVTASMNDELAQAQAGIDDLMMFVGDVVAGLRVALVAYRDERDEFEVKAWDFTSDANEARQRLWSLTAAGGGDLPEAVFPALRVALGRLSWRPVGTRILILLGDAPPHAGFGSQSVELAQRAQAEGGVTTHTIEAGDRPVKHFPEIAAAGGGRSVTLGDATGSLILEIAGLTLAERFEEELRDFFTAWLELCR